MRLGRLDRRLLSVPLLPEGGLLMSTWPGLFMAHKEPSRVRYTSPRLKRREREPGPSLAPQACVSAVNNPGWVRTCAALLALVVVLAPTANAAEDPAIERAVEHGVAYLKRLLQAQAGNADSAPA